MKLISLTDFVLEREDYGYFKEYKDYKVSNIQEIREYAEILQTELELSMFLPEHPSDNKGISFENVTFDEVKGQEGVKFYCVGQTQVFNLSNNDQHVYWHHNTIESLLRECDDSIEFTINKK